MTNQSCHPQGRGDVSSQIQWMMCPGSPSHQRHSVVGTALWLLNVLGKVRYLGTLPTPRTTDPSRMVRWRCVIASNCATSDHSDDKRQISRMNRAGLSQVVNGFQGCSRICADEGSQGQVPNPELIQWGYHSSLFFKSLNRTQTSLGAC